MVTGWRRSFPGVLRVCFVFLFNPGDVPVEVSLRGSVTCWGGGVGAAAGRKKTHDQKGERASEDARGGERLLDRGRDRCRGIQAHALTSCELHHCKSINEPNSFANWEKLIMILCM
jgi:hypothetical protein